MIQRRILAIMVALATTQPAMAQNHGNREPDPAHVLDRTMHRLNRATRHTTHSLLRQSGFCARNIHRLLQSGDEESAADLAERCTNLLNRTAEVGTTLVDQGVERGIEILTEWEAPAEMITTLQSLGEEKASMINTRLERALQIVQEALNDSPPDGS